MCISQRTFSFSLVMFTQILTRPLFFRTTTMPEHHSVGFITLAITPSFTILSSSDLTAFITGMGTRLRVLRE